MIIDQAERWNAEFGIAFNVRSLFAEAWFDEYLLEFSQDILDTTKKDISQMLQQAMKNGWTIDEMTRQLDMTFQRYLDPDFTIEGRRLTDEERQWFIDRSPRFRRDILSRTETIRASNSGSLELFRAWGVVERKMWEATADDRTRASHLRAWSDYTEGGTPGPIPLDAFFHIGGSRLQYPGDPNGDISETAQCRCVNLPWFSDVPLSQEEVERAQGFIEGELARRDETGL